LIYTENWLDIEDVMNLDLDKTKNWMSVDKFAIHAKKCHFIIFGNIKFPKLIINIANESKKSVS
jgi:hypothetical protein